MAKCTLCGEEVSSISHVAEQATLKLIQRMNPAWVENDGACPKCLDYYQNLDSKVTYIPDSSA